MTFFNVFLLFLVDYYILKWYCHLNVNVLGENAHVLKTFTDKKAMGMEMDDL
jgi:hypothetical protein